MSDEKDKPTVTRGGRVFRNFRPAKNKNGKTVIVPKDMDQFLVWNLPDDYVYLESNQDTLEEILVALAEGDTLTKACKDLELPFSVVLMYIHRHPEYEKKVRMAQRMRAEGYHDKLQDIVDDVTEGTAKSAKVKADVLKHLMSVGDRDRFGEQKKVDHTGGQTVTFIVDTGIRREAIPTEGKVVDGTSDHDQDQHGLPAPASAIDDPREHEALQCAGVPSSVREDGSVHQRAGGSLPEGDEA